MTTQLTPVGMGTVGEAVSEEVLERLSKTYKKEDTAENEGLPMLKINYEEESKVAKKGQWVLGQRRNQDGEISEEGELVGAFIPIVMRNAYSWYDQKNMDNNCNSPIFADFSEVVRGNKWKEICGKKTCPHAADNKCKAQKVVYGVAITKKSGLVDCVAYFKGAAYMPISDYMASASKLEIGGISRKVAPFTRIANLVKIGT